MSQEIEFKLRVTAKSVSALKRHPLVLRHLTAAPLRHKLTSIYYDTPDFKLLNADLSLRVRRFAGHWYQSIKTAGSVNKGLHNREEWEDALKNNAPDFDKARAHSGLPAAIFADRNFCQMLAPIFITEVWRTEWQLMISQHHIEIALDTGKLIVPQANIHKAISEVELELKYGHDISVLQSLADTLRHDLDLIPEDTSKAEMGYRLLKS